VLHDVHFLEQMAHFNREKVIERQPHAKGSGAFGVFETTADVSRYTRAALVISAFSIENLKQPHDSSN
jgi:catalase